MCLARNNRRDRQTADGGGFGVAWPCPTRCRDRRRVGARTAARPVRSGARGRQLRGWLRGDAGAHLHSGRDAAGLAEAAGSGTARRRPVCTGTGRNRTRSGAADAGRAARSGDVVARGIRRGALRRVGRRSDRVVAQPSRSRLDREPAAGAGGGGVGRHHAASSCRGRARSQRRADSLEHLCCPLCRAGGRRTRPTRVHHRIVAPTWPPRWRTLASGVGS